jgi:hypothetical protein
MLEMSSCRVCVENEVEDEFFFSFFFSFFFFFFFFCCCCEYSAPTSSSSYLQHGQPVPDSGRIPFGQLGDDAIDAVNGSSGESVSGVREKA